MTGDTQKLMARTGAPGHVERKGPVAMNNNGTEPTTAELMSSFGFSTPGPRSVFLQLRKAVRGHGELNARTKALIGLAVCITGCREDALEDDVLLALRAGASRPEILEVIGQAILMGGARSIPFGQRAAEVAEAL